MKGINHPKNDVTINPSCNESIHDVINRTDLGRRKFIKSSMAASVLAAMGGVSVGGFMRTVEAAQIAPANGFGGIGFESIPAKKRLQATYPVFADAVEVPAGYKVELLAAWGMPIMPGAPAWNPDATQDAAAQEKQFGMHNDGMHFFPFPTRGGGASGLSSERGLLCVNHEYTHEQILHGAEGLTGGAGVTIQKVRKSQAAHGVAVMELRKIAGKWGVNKASPYGRRTTANSLMKMSGPAAGHALLKSKKFDITPAGSAEIGVNDGFTAFGTVNNCANGYTPWGTYITCEENWNGYFGWLGTDAAPADPDGSIVNGQVRYGITQNGAGYAWHTVDPRFNARTNPLEPHLFGWRVEIDPFNPNSVPVKRTAMGRFKCESAQVALSADAAGTPNRVGFYMGDDERNEYIYKFVCAQAFNPQNRAANRDLLDSGTLYVAKFLDTPVAGKTQTYRGVWLPLVPGADTVFDDAANPGAKLKLRDLPQFAGADDAEVQAKILIKTRQAADALGATMMDRPEWTALRTYYDPATPGYAVYGENRPLEVYCTLTNNSRRGNTPVSSNNPNGTTGAAAANPPVDLANPRPDNDFGHIIRWREDGNYVTATGFEWDIFVLCGDTATTKTLPASYNTANLVGGVAGVGPAYQGNIVDIPDGSADIGAPDGLWFDQFGRLWIQTDQAGDGTGDFVNIGANTMSCADPNSKEIRRFLTSPPNCEVTGIANTPDGKTLFVGIQHPGEDSPASNPTQFSRWPQSQWDKNSAGEPLAVVAGAAQPVGAAIRPRASVLVITREDGGIIGGL
jgi:hypothetical protein